jgi:hypothetical protein
MSKQTAVDWLFLMINNPNDNQEMALKCLEKAKQMEKEQIMEAVYDSMGTNFDPNMGRAELYYKEKYGNGGHK